MYHRQVGGEDGQDTLQIVTNRPTITTGHSADCHQQTYNNIDRTLCRLSPTDLQQYRQDTLQIVTNRPTKKDHQRQQNNISDVSKHEFCGTPHRSMLEINDVVLYCSSDRFGERNDQVYTCFSNLLIKAA